MKHLRSLFNRINDVEATLARIDAESAEQDSLAYQLTVNSLEKRRDVLRQELEEATREGFVEVCDYRLISDDAASYAISGVTSVLRDFQDLVTIVYDAITDRPKSKAPRNAEVIQKTQFDFGFAYGGSLGIALVIEHDRELVDSDLDRAIAAVFDMMKSNSAQQVHQVAVQYGRASVRKLYSWSKTHSEYGLSADIKWVRGGSEKKAVLAQPQELAEICRIIESRTEPETEPVDITGTLVSWDTVNRRFIIDVPDADPIKGVIAEVIDLAHERAVPHRYTFKLLMHTVTDYSLDQEKVTWELTDLTELN